MSKSFYLITLGTGDGYSIIHKKGIELDLQHFLKACEAPSKVEKKNLKVCTLCFSGSN